MMSIMKLSSQQIFFCQFLGTPSREGNKTIFLRLKGIDRPFRGGVESILIRSLLVNWRIGYFLSYFKGPSSQDQQKNL
jgi:hypothetical protein